MKVLLPSWFKERLYKEGTESVPENIEVRIVAPSGGQYGVRTGDSILCKLKILQRRVRRSVT